MKRNIHNEIKRGTKNNGKYDSQDAFLASASRCKNPYLFVIDENRKKSDVLLNIKEYERLLNTLEDLADSSDFAKAKKTSRKLSIPIKDAERIVNAIDSLSQKPRPHGTKELVKHPGWRIRIGNYRILYEIDDLDHTVTVYRAGHRRNVYPCEI